MFGLFGLRGAFGPVVLMVGLIIFTILVHMSIDNALGPLLYNLPKTLSVEEEDFQRSAKVMESVAQSTGPDVENQDAHAEEEEPVELEDEMFHTGEETTRGGYADLKDIGKIEGAEGAVSFAKDFLKEKVGRTLYLDEVLNRLTAAMAPMVTPDPNIKPNFFMHWLHPEVYDDYSILRKSIPDDLPDPTYEPQEIKDIYLTPAMWKPAPRVWIPRDVAGVSAQECEHSSPYVTITDEGAWLDAETSGLIVDINRPNPILEKRIRYW